MKSSNESSNDIIYIIIISSSSSTAAGPGSGRMTFSQPNDHGSIDRDAFGGKMFLPIRHQTTEDDAHLRTVIASNIPTRTLPSHLDMNVGADGTAHLGGVKGGEDVRG
jgi:hypothetical protein